MKFFYKDGKPIIQVFVGLEEEIELIGIIDSGADYSTVPVDICDALNFQKLKDIEVSIPGGTLIVPIYRGVITIAGLKKEIEIAGLSLPPKLNIDCLVGRNFFGNLDIHLLGKQQKLVIDVGKEK